VVVSDQQPSLSHLSSEAQHVNAATPNLAAWRSSVYEVFFRHMVAEGTSPSFNKLITLILCLKCRSRYSKEMAANLAHATGAETIAPGFARTE